MRLKTLLLATAIALVGLSSAVTGQQLIDGIKVDLPYAVTVGEIVLEPGEYEIRRASQNQDQVLQIFSNDKMRYQTSVITVPALDNKTPEDTKDVLHHIGDNYYFDKIWIQGKDYGYEFVLPERARALKRELAATVPATYNPAASASTSTQNPTASVTAPSAESTRPAAAENLPAVQPQPTQRVEAQAPVTSAQPPAPTSAEQDRQALAERDRQAESVAQAAPPPVLPQAAPTPQTTDPSLAARAQEQNQTPDTSRSSAGETNQLPATSANWLGWVLGGAALITLSALVRPKVSE